LRLKDRYGREQFYLLELGRSAHAGFWESLGGVVQVWIPTACMVAENKAEWTCQAEKTHSQKVAVHGSARDLPRLSIYENRA
jgi:hypothetical protein